MTNRTIGSKSTTIEIRGPNEATQIDLPAHWTIHDVTAVRQILEAAGYESAVPTTDSLFAYQRAEDREAGGGYACDLEVYALGREVDLRITDKQSPLPLRAVAAEQREVS